jgi:signal peptidase I
LFLLAKIAAIALVLVLLFTFMYGLYRGADPGMKPAIQDGDLVLFYRLDKNYVAGDVLLLDFEGQRQARRVVAVAGDAVDIVEEGLVINGSLQQEPDIYQATQRYAEGVEFPLTVGEGQVFVLGDARAGATDSRIYGAVDVDDTLGKVITILRRRNI